MYPFEYGQTIRIKRLNRQWKGKFPKDPYERNMKGADVYIDQNNGQLHMYLYWDLNADRLTGDKEYSVLVECPVDQTQFVAHAQDWYHDYAGPKIHRPKSIINYFKLRSKKGDKEVDVDWCNNWLAIYNTNSNSPDTSKQHSKNNSSNDNSKCNDNSGAKSAVKSKAKSKEKTSEKSKEKTKVRDKDEIE